MNTVPVPQALDSLIAVHTLNRMYQGAAGMLEQHLGVPLCIQCGACCRHNTPFAYGVEAANAVSRLLGQGNGYQIQRRIEGWLLERHKECTVYQPLHFNKVTSGIDTKVRDEALALSRTGCPFYEDHACIIYEARPLVCRAYGVTTHVNKCPRPYGRGESANKRIYMTGPPVEELRRNREAILNTVPKPTWAMAGFFPTLVFSLIWPETYSRHVANGLIATAKLIMTSPTMAVLEEPVEAMTDKDIVLTGAR